MNKKNRNKREEKPPAGPPKNRKKNKCSLVLVADHRFYQSIGNNNEKQTSAYLVRLIE